MTRTDYQLNKLHETLDLMKKASENLATMPELENKMKALYEEIRAKYERMYNEATI